MSPKVILVIMDGWGIARDPRVSAIDAAKTPFYDASLRTRPHAKLFASEEQVGLPAGQMGNSEVGHMNIGAGRIVYQELVRVGLSISSGAFADIAAYQALIAYCKDNRKPLHLLGLLSDGGVHSHIDHVTGILRLLAHEKDMPPVYLHLFMDGRDTDPYGGLGYVATLEQAIAETGVGQIASVIGRYDAMDRNLSWDRTAKAYKLLRDGDGAPFASAKEAIQASYDAGTTDEFVPPSVIVADGKPVGLLQEGDAVLFYNFRTDRGRQLTTALTQRDFPEEGMTTMPLYYCTMTRYDDKYTGVNVLFEKDNIQMGLGEALAEQGKAQIRIAETEKYPHVTFFFNGGREEPFVGETRILCPSPKVATYDLQPTMSAFEIRDKIIAELEKGEVDFVCLNFANPDMVGHTGIFEAAVKACETVDACTQAVVEAATAHGYFALVTADHGNADCMINPDGSPNTAHSTALVPLILHQPQGDTTHYTLADGKLGDLAPTILHLMGLGIPPEMTGHILVNP
jgi:2,3-bisphosphoglycerate-independent phosphoglycerate mutase